MFRNSLFTTVLAGALGISAAFALPGCQTPPRAHPEALIGEVEPDREVREARPKAAPGLKGKSLQWRN